MIDKVLDAIQEGIYNDTGLMIVDTDNNEKKPKYPFYSFKILSSPLSPNQVGAMEVKAGEDIIEESLVMDSNMIISFNAYSDKVRDSHKFVLKAWEWFKFKGYHYLSDRDIVVVNLSNIQDRTITIVDKFEYRQGFDVELRVLHQIDRELETIETYKIEGGVNK